MNLRRYKRVIKKKERAVLLIEFRGIFFQNKEEGVCKSERNTIQIYTKKIHSLTLKFGENFNFRLILLR
jgi:hypothetical protein